MEATTANQAGTCFCTGQCKTNGVCPVTGAKVTTYPFGETVSAPKPDSTSLPVWTMCRFCSGLHTEEQCPRVIEIRYYKDGRIKWVKLKMNWE